MSDPIAKVTTYRVHLPYKGTVRLRSVHDTSCPFLILVLETKNGATGIAESYARPQMSDGTDLSILCHQIDELFKPALIGAVAEDIPSILETSRIRNALSARSLIDIAGWDLRAKLIGQPVWRLIGCTPVDAVPVTKVVFGNTSSEMIDDAVRAVQQGYTSLKIKVWKRSSDDIDMVRDIRKEAGANVFIYVDANTTYSEGEARRLFPRLLDYDVALIEDPCRFTSIDRMADLARDLPIPMMADAYAGSLGEVYDIIARRAAGAISTKLRRPGLTQAIKVAGLCEAANIPAIVGTDLESRIGVLPRLHLRAALPYLASWPAELQFFENLADDCLDGDLAIENGTLSVPDGPGFGAQLDMAKLETYCVR